MGFIIIDRNTGIGLIGLIRLTNVIVAHVCMPGSGRSFFGLFQWIIIIVASIMIAGWWFGTLFISHAVGNYPN